MQQIRQRCYRVQYYKGLIVIIKLESKVLLI